MSECHHSQPSGPPVSPVNVAACHSLPADSGGYFEPRWVSHTNSSRHLRQAAKTKHNRSPPIFGISVYTSLIQYNSSTPFNSIDPCKYGIVLVAGMFNPRFPNTNWSFAIRFPATIFELRVYISLRSLNSGGNSSARNSTTSTGPVHAAEDVENPQKDTEILHQEMVCRGFLSCLYALIHPNDANWLMCDVLLMLIAEHGSNHKPTEVLRTCFLKVPLWLEQKICEKMWQKNVENTLAHGWKFTSEQEWHLCWSFKSFRLRGR